MIARSSPRSFGVDFNWCQSLLFVTRLLQDFDHRPAHAHHLPLAGPAILAEHAAGCHAEGDAIAPFPPHSRTPRTATARDCAPAAAMPPTQTAARSPPSGAAAIQREQSLVCCREQFGVRVARVGKFREQLGHVIAGVQTSQIALGRPEPALELAFGQQVQGVGRFAEEHYANQREQVKSALERHSWAAGPPWPKPRSCQNPR